MLEGAEDADVTSVLALGPDTFAADLWYGNARHATVWRLPT
jgi:hypothetical protein